ncbi:type II toxin-antitoxin system VapC family toxin [Microbacterium sp.]|uniref:type II toxin-antitoxin system VapC family toxin n=1 Tax=Microbacterium sp. TaxID=51671 RepID=UPI0039E29174
MYLVDTNTFSEARRSGAVGEAAREWMATVAFEGLFMSVISDFELERGVLLLERRDLRQGIALRQWLNGIRLQFGQRMLPVTAEIARICAAIQVPDRRPFPDALIAATALHHGLTVVTRNVRDFEVPGLAVINPCEGIDDV